jgi:dCTP diphosphatase
MATNDLSIYSADLYRFVVERQWDRYQNPKDLTMALAGEAGELITLFQWLTPGQSVNRLGDDQFRREVSYEMADILNYLLRLSWAADIDLIHAAYEKLAINQHRFPASSTDLGEYPAGGNDGSPTLG